MKSISVHELKKILDRSLPKQHLLLDVRTAGEYSSEHIAQAHNVPLDEISKHTESLKKYDVIYTQCQSGSRSSKACQQLFSMGLENIINIEGGISAWISAHYPTTKGKGAISIMRQVQIIAGGLVLAGALLAYFVDPRFLFLSGVIGAGLLFAGISGTCAMGTCLSKMPWNK